ncbi:hypothetical protein AYI69_g6199 [Smittium culicis]|uniref:CSC1/OSCA1-like cytosolic domain-containing protein n=1 Tax=Smittium culicis TaxID=133412 RepID=A0A1R1Y0N2_9FUNG|nr:hypothetical protein AYI69_g6199 [Smittium culicis]
MVSKIPNFLVEKPASLKWLWEDGVGAGKVENIRVCPDDTKFLQVIKQRAQVLAKLENEYQYILGNPCIHPDYNRKELFDAIMTEGPEARQEERGLLLKWAQPHHIAVKHRLSCGKESRKACEERAREREDGSESCSIILNRRKMLIRDKSGGKKFKFKRVDKIDHLRNEFIRLDLESEKFREKFDEPVPSSTAFVTFEDAATAHMVCQTSMYPNPSKMVVKMAPEPRGVNSNFEFIPTYLWRHPPPSDSYPLPPSSGKDDGNGNVGKDMKDRQNFEKKSEDTLQKHNSYGSLKGGEGGKSNNVLGMEKLNLPNINSYNISSVFSPYGFLFDADTNKVHGIGPKKRSKLRHYESESPINYSNRHFVDVDIKNAREKVGDGNNLNVYFFNQNANLGESVFKDPKYGYMENWILNKEKLNRNKTLVGANKKSDLKKTKAKRVKSRILSGQKTRENVLRKNSESVFSHKKNNSSFGHNRSKEAQINNSFGLRNEIGAKKYIKSSSPAIGYDSSVVNESSYSDSKFKAVKSLNSMLDSDTDAVAKASGVLLSRNKNEVGTGKLRKRGIRKNGGDEYGSVEHKNMEVLEYKNYMGAVNRKNPLFDGKLGDGIRSKPRILGVDGNEQLDDLHVEEIKLIENMILAEEGGGLYSRSNSTYSLRDGAKRNGIDTGKSKGSKLDNILDNYGYKNTKNENVGASKNSEKISSGSLKKLFGYKNSGNNVLSSTSVSNTSFYSSDNGNGFDCSKKGLAIRLNTENSLYEKEEFVECIAIWEHGKQFGFGGGIYIR